MTALRILVLAPFSPAPDARHGGRVVAPLLEELASRHRIGLLHLHAEGERPVADSLRRVCAFVEDFALPAIPAHGAAAWRRRLRLLPALASGIPMQAVDACSRALDRRVREVVDDWQPDVVQLELTVMGRYLDAVTRPCARILVAHDVGAETAREVAGCSRGLERVVRTLDASAWSRYERRALRRVDAVVTLTEEDAGKLRRVAAVPILTIPLVPPVPDRPLDPVGSAPHSVVFVGGFGHPPNVEAATRLASSVFPLVRREVPDAELAIVGSKPTPAVTALAGPHVDVAGDVDSVTPYLERAAVVVAPLRVGGGMRVKVLETLGAGKALVASRRAIAGLDLRDGEHVVLAESDAEIAAAIVSLLTDPGRRAQLGAAARRFAQAHAGVSAAAASYDELYRSFMKKAEQTLTAKTS